MVDPLTAFVSWRWPAPYEAKTPRFAFAACVVPVRSKSGLVTSNRGGIAHIADGIAALLDGGPDNGWLRYGARWRCSGGTNNATLIDSADKYGGVCAKCTDALQPAVYRCFDGTGRLLYIGSTGQPGRRFQSHETQTPWWTEVTSIKTERYPTLPLARAAERMAIRSERPAYNQQHQLKISSVRVEDGAA